MADSNLKCNFYKINRRQAALASDLLERSNKRNTDETLPAAHQRATISDMRVRKAGFNQTEIADEIGVNKSTICRELSRNRGQRGWRPKQAQELRDKRRQVCNHAKRFAREYWNKIDRLIRQDMRPQQASARLELENELSISHETIYQYIYADKRAGGELWQHLRCQKPRRKRYASGFDRRGTIRNRVSIDKRPKIVEQRVRIGDWEGDTVIGKNHKGALVTLAERKLRYVLAGQLCSKHSVGVTEKINSLLRPYMHKCHTVTFDNGKEFAEHETIALELEADIYFAHPYHSWERGLNENSNGLLRQYFPKNMDLTDVTEEQVQRAVDRLNHRPRKVLGFRTPHEIFFGLSANYTKQPAKVALRI